MNFTWDFILDAKDNFKNILVKDQIDIISHT